MNNRFLIFDCIGILVDGHRMRKCYQQNMSRVMSARYGNSPDFWQSIDEQIVADWSSYHADLNFSGDDGIADMHEAVFRVTRGLFTIGNLPEPPKPEITALSKELISIPCDDRVLLPHIAETLSVLKENGYHTGTFAHLLQAQLEAVTVALPMIENHIGADTLNHYDHDRQFFIKIAAYLKTQPDDITLMTLHATTADAASQSGFKVLTVGQSPASHTHILKDLLED